MLFTKDNIKIKAHMQNQLNSSRNFSVEVTEKIDGILAQSRKQK